jgi:hypothetical protein
VCLALELIDAGDSNKAKAVLQRLSGILPTPTHHNIESARTSLIKQPIITGRVGHG